MVHPEFECGQVHTRKYGFLFSVFGGVKHRETCCCTTYNPRIEKRNPYFFHLERTLIPDEPFLFQIPEGRNEELGNQNEESIKNKE